jgi:ferrochelatase
MIIFVFLPRVRASHSQNRHYKSHCKIDGSCCNTPSPAHEFCYRHQCYETTKQVVKLLGIPEGKYSQTFQSRLAGDKWLTPYTDVRSEQNA